MFYNLKLYLFYAFPTIFILFLSVPTMILFFDWVSSEGYIALLNEERVLLYSNRFFMAWNESSKTIWIIDSFLQWNSISYSDITEIVCVNGPGSFTWIRTITLVVNTLAFSFPHIRLSGLSIFDLYTNYPQVFPSSKRDLFVKYEKWAIIVVVKNEDFQSKLWDTAIIYWDIDTTRFEKSFECDSSRNYETFIWDFCLQSLQQLSPLYLKKPNIS